MKIIGHRGAAGLALENTEESFRRALEAGVDGIELDVRRTKDQQLVVLHDATTRRIAPVKRRAAANSLAEMQKVKLHNGEHLLSLDEALKIIGNTPVIIEPKDPDTAKLIVAVLRRHPQSKAMLTSFLHKELAEARRLLPSLHVFASEHFDPLQAVQHAQRIRADGITLNKWLLNPLTYYLAQRQGLRLYAYSVNNLWVARILLKLYPNIAFYTDRPDRLQSLRHRG